MSHEQIVVLFVVSFCCVLYFVVLHLLKCWQRKHELFYVVFRTPETHLKYCVEFFRSKDDLHKWLSDYRPLITLFGVYKLIPSDYLKEFGGFYNSSKSD